MYGFLYEIGVVLVVSVVLGLFIHRIRQPIILGYILAGILIGPEIGLKIVTNPSNIQTIGKIGLILLLFVVALEIEIKKVLSLGKDVLLSGICSLSICVGLALIFFSLLGFSGEKSHEGLYLSLAFAISSTSIVVKLLYDKDQLDTLAGGMSLGILIIQDFYAILLFTLQPNLFNPSLSFFFLSILKGLALFFFTFLFSKYILSRIFHYIAKLPELVVLTSLGWCALISGLAGYIGFSMEMGALIAGMAISVFPFHLQIKTKVLSLRDFFLTLFFASLGMQVSFPDKHLLLLVLLASLFVIFSRFVSIYPILRIFKKGERTAFLTSLNLSQISEFSLVIVSLGISFGHISKDILNITIFVMIFTGIISSYFIEFNYEIYKRIERLLKKSSVGEERKKDMPARIIFLGFHRGLRNFLEEISERKEMLKDILVVDFSPEVLREVSYFGVKGIYGDVSHLDVLEHVGVSKAEIILSTLPDVLLRGTNNRELTKACRLLNPSAFIVATAAFPKEVEGLKEVGADDVILPYVLVGKYLATNIIKPEE